MVEDNEVKAAYPTVTNIAVTYDRITISTDAESPTVRWIGDGEVVWEGGTIDLTNLPADLGYVRAEIDDGQGRTVFTQPFSLGPPIPPPPGEPVPTLPGEAAVLLALALLATALYKSPQFSTRT